MKIIEYLKRKLYSPHGSEGRGDTLAKWPSHQSEPPYSNFEYAKQMMLGAGAMDPETMERLRSELEVKSKMEEEEVFDDEEEKKLI